MKTDLGGEIFQDGGEVNWSSGTDTVGVFTRLQEAGDPANGELETCFCAPRDAFLDGAGAERFSSSGHCSQGREMGFGSEEGLRVQALTIFGTAESDGSVWFYITR